MSLTSYILLFSASPKKLMQWRPHIAKKLLRCNGTSAYAYIHCAVALVEVLSSGVEVVVEVVYHIIEEALLVVYNSLQEKIEEV